MLKFLYILFYLAQQVKLDNFYDEAYIMIRMNEGTPGNIAVSYTHLDVYKRQDMISAGNIRVLICLWFMILYWKYFSIEQQQEQDNSC